MDIFRTYHPTVCCTYFIFAILFSVMFKHPFYIVISFIFSVLYNILLKTKNLKYAVLIMSVIIITYPLFNHGGITIILYFPSGNPLTEESVIYAFASGFSVAGTVSWILCCTKILTSDKIMCVTGKIHPCFSLFISTLVRFIPRFLLQFKKNVSARKYIQESFGNIYFSTKIKIYLSSFSTTVTWASENIIELSDSMKSRGYGTKERTSYTPYTFKKRDVHMLITIVILIIFTFFSAYCEKFSFFPVTHYTCNSILNFLAYLIFCSLPFIFEVCRNIKHNIIINKVKVTATK